VKVVLVVVCVYRSAQSSIMEKLILRKLLLELSLRFLRPVHIIPVFVYNVESVPKPARKGQLSLTMRVRILSIRNSATIAESVFQAVNRG
jgi:hypothetical protein